MADATFRHGDNVLSIDYTPEAAVDGGDVVVVGTLVGVAHVPIAAAKLGALAVTGGVYRFAKTAGSGTAFTAGAKVYWDADPGAITATSSGNTAFGYTIAAASDDDTTVDVLHTTF